MLSRAIGVARGAIVAARGYFVHPFDDVGHGVHSTNGQVVYEYVLDAQVPQLAGVFRELRHMGRQGNDQLERPTTCPAQPAPVPPRGPVAPRNKFKGDLNWLGAPSASPSSDM